MSARTKTSLNHQTQTAVNVNTILGGLGTILCGLILWTVTGAMNTNKETAKTVTTISAQLPYLASAADVKEAKAASDSAKESIKEVKEDVREVKGEQAKVRVELERNLFPNKK